MVRDMLTRVDERLLSARWPALRLLDRLEMGERDCLLVVGGFEERALSVLRSAAGEADSFQVVLIKYLPVVKENRDEECVKLCRDARLPLEELVYDRENPSSAGDSIAEYLCGFDNVFVDVSGMSRLLIVQIVVAMIERAKAFSVLYTEADVYPPEEDEFRRKQHGEQGGVSFISSGIFEIVSCPELSSVSMLGGAIRLISFPSFDPVQLSNVVQELQPTHNDVINGVPPDQSMRWRTEAISELNKANMSALQRVREHKASTFDYRETLEIILKLYKMHSVYDRLVIAPTGSKMQAVAVGILRGVLTDLQIVYPTPLKFLDPAHYTEGAKATFQLSIGSVLTDIGDVSR